MALSIDSEVVGIPVPGAYRKIVEINFAAGRDGGNKVQIKTVDYKDRAAREANPDVFFNGQSIDLYPQPAPGRMGPPQPGPDGSLVQKRLPGLPGYDALAKTRGLDGVVTVPEGVATAADLLQALTAHDTLYTWAYWVLKQLPGNAGAVDA